MNTYTKTKIGLIQFLLVFLISTAYGQKVKYKDIYALLSTKQYEQAEPFLKRYLAENTDEPSGNLFMGMILQEKASNNDLLKQTSRVLTNLDSAVFFYEKAYQTITDREIRKNKDYYQTYNRRDLRTGEFGVKLTDIQFDIEKRIQALKERSSRLKMTKGLHDLAVNSYSRAQALYASLQSFPTLRQLYLRSDEGTIATLTNLSLSFDSCVKAFDQFKLSLATLEKTGYNQKLAIANIKDFTVDGKSEADFFADEVKLWDYKTFADEALRIARDEIIPMRSNLVSYDQGVNKLHEKLAADSVSVRNDLTRLIDKLLYSQLKKFDPAPLPMLIFGLKTTNLEYNSTLLEHKPFRDSSDLHLRIGLVEKELKLLKQLDSTAALLPADKLDEKILDYTDFVTKAYGDGTAVKHFIQAQHDFSARELKKRTALLSEYRHGLQYVVDGQDSIPLSPELATVHYAPLLTTPEKFTAGLSLKDTTQLSAYFYTVERSRQAAVKAYFPVDKSAFRVRSVSAARVIAQSDPLDQIFYVLIYSDNPVKDKIPATLAKIYRSDGLAWKTDYPLTFRPDALTLTSNGEVVISDGTQQLMVDKNGKVLK